MLLTAVGLLRNVRSYEVLAVGSLKAAFLREEL
jgi:hypothetical protein